MDHLSQVPGDRAPSGEPEADADKCSHAYERQAGAAAFCLVIALVIGGALWYLTSPARWPSTQGVVLESHYFPYGGHLWGPSIIYEYEAGGRAHRSENLTLWKSPSRYELDTTLWPWDAKRLVEGHPPGTAIEVRHHPHRHGHAVIAWTVNHPSGLAAIAAVVVCLALAWFFWMKALGAKAARAFDAMVLPRV